MMPRNCRQPKRRPHCADRRQAALTSFDDIVASYVAEYRGRARRELEFYAMQPDLKRAISVAALSQRPGDGKRHSHQCRVSHRVLKAALETLLSTDLSAASTFADLHSQVDKEIGSIRGIGPLTVYDVAHRIGGFLGLSPEAVYLHAGTREGASSIGLRGKVVPKSTFPPAFQRLTPAEIEDCLCIYKDDLKRLRQRRPR